jgi:hypothetical protein
MRRRVRFVCAVAALATMIGCGLFPEHDLLHLEAQLPVGYATTFTVVNGARQEVFAPDDMSLRVPPNVRSRTTVVDEDQSVRVAFVVTSPAGDTLVNDFLELPTGDEFEYAVSLHRKYPGLPSHCFGCDGQRDYPRDPGDTSRDFDIHVTWVARRPCLQCVY